jgi:hypothetical protein
MRIPKSWVPGLAKRIIENLIRNKLLESNVPLNNLLEETEALMMEELMVEDRLHEEIRAMLRKFESDIEKGRMDYRKLFEMTKHKLVKERNIIL